MTNRIRGILAELKLLLSQLYGERLDQIILYGSQARGDARPDSDIDVLIVLKGKVNPWQEIIRSGSITSDISLRCDVVITTMFVSPEEYDHLEEPYLNNVRREGITI